MTPKTGIITNKPGQSKYSILPEPQNSELLLPVAGVHAKARDKAILAKRTTKNSQKLKLFPEGEPKELEVEEKEITSVNLPHVLATAKKDDWLLNKLERKWLPRVTGYCTANSYKMDLLFDDLKKRGLLNGTNPKRFDEVIYSTFTWEGSIVPNIEYQTSAEPQSPTEPFLFQNIDSNGQEIPENYPVNFLAKRIAPYAEVLFFEYGVVVMWGFNPEEESRMLDYLRLFEEESLIEEDIQTEEFHFHYHINCQPRIFNDVITLKNPSNFMIKLTISHSIAQSCKLALFEGLMDQTIGICYF